MVDADIVARQVVEPGTHGLDLIVANFGSEYLLPDGMLNREKLGKLVFANRWRMDVLNTIMAPIIHTESDRQLAELHAAGHQIVGYDAALIIEQGNAKKYRPLIVVQCPEDTQIARLMSRNTLTRAEAVARIDAQLAVAEKVKMANYVVDTSGTVENSIEQTKKIIHELERINQSRVL
jgi:dephospho-CoA kinase